MQGFDPQQSSWMQWALSGIGAAFTALLGLLVAFGRDSAKIYRGKVDALEQKHSTFAASCITREELREELSQRFNDMDTRRIQMHNHNAELLGGIDKRIGELREDIQNVHTRIDGIQK